MQVLKMDLVTIMKPYLKELMGKNNDAVHLVINVPTFDSIFLRYK
ncbi:hypothetical protein [Clostridium fermenticellae]|nr:hypothetical protein [Clostridium fermenticellae]